MYHVELRQFPHVARVFNLSREELETRFVRAWVSGAIIEHEDRGWAAAIKSAADVTEAVIAQARRGAEARPELEALKDAVGEVAATPLGFQDVMALAAAAHPHWRASQQLELAEQAVWEMLHQGRLAMTVNGSAVRRERWQPIVLSWATWAGITTEPFRLQVPVASERVE